MTETNTSQLAIQQQEQQKGDEQDIPTHRYILRNSPTKWKEIVSMTQTGQVTGVESDSMTIHPKTHAHVILTQLNVKQGLIEYEKRKQGNTERTSTITQNTGITAHKETT